MHSLGLRLRVKSAQLTAVQHEQCTAASRVSKRTQLLASTDLGEESTLITLVMHQHDYTPVERAAV